LLKLNLANDSPHGVLRVIIEYIREHSNAEIVVAEGCGYAILETPEIFKRLGYTEMADRHGVSLLAREDKISVSGEEPVSDVIVKMRSSDTFAALVAALSVRTIEESFQGIIDWVQIGKTMTLSIGLPY